MQFQDLSDIQHATRRGQREFFRFGMGLLFVVGIMIYSTLALGVSGPQGTMVVVAAMIGGYMAMNIGANDVANNVGPAVGSKSITMGGAIVIAAVFEMLGALVAGGEVVSTIRGGIIDVNAIPSTEHFVWLMTASLLAGALWLNLATAVGAPVSTTHSIVGAVLGAGVMAGGFGAADWGVVVNIVASWLVSPLLGGVVAAAFLFWIKRAITYRSDMILAAQRTVPLLIGLMAFAFASYLLLKGLNKVWSVSFWEACGFGALAGVLVWGLVWRAIRVRSATLTNTKKSINSLFTLPLIFAAALLSFAHGANDVANAVGPLAAIADAVLQGGFSDEAGIPLWVMLIGALGIAIGLALYGPKLIRTVGGEITDLDQMRAFCIAMSAALTVIIASQLGLPVSSTHIAIGGIFGVGFLREHLKSNYSQMLEEIKMHHSGADKQVVEEFLDRFAAAAVDTKQSMLRQLKANSTNVTLSKKEYKQMRRMYRGELVKRSAFTKIIAAWIITVPMSAGLSALLYWLMSSVL